MAVLICRGGDSPSPSAARWVISRGTVDNRIRSVAVKMARTVKCLIGVDEKISFANVAKPLSSAETSAWNMKPWHAVCVYIYARKLDRWTRQIGPNKFRFINIECFDIDYLIEIIFLALAKRMIERSFVVNGFLRSLIYLCKFCKMF